MCSIGLSREKFTRNASFGIFLSLFESIAYACLAYILLVPLGVSPTFTLNPENLAPISIFLMPLTFILVVGPSEEIQDRGYFQTRLLEHFGPRFSIIFTSLLFALSHIPIDVFIWRYDVSMMSFHLLGVFVSGCILGYLFYRTGVLTGPIFLHALVDTQAFAYAFEFDYKKLNSEVAFGIEGLTWAAITALTFLLIRLLTSRLGLKVENLPWETATEKEEQRTNE
ncbi:MAG: lysostaphin resistance A-like protein [Candidatus Bathyarchaeia archaeon]